MVEHVGSLQSTSTFRFLAALVSTGFLEEHECRKVFGMQQTNSLQESTRHITIASVPSVHDMLPCPILWLNIGGVHDWKIAVRVPLETRVCKQITSYKRRRNERHVPRLCLMSRTQIGEFSLNWHSGMGTFTKTLVRWSIVSRHAMSLEEQTRV